MNLFFIDMNLDNNCFETIGALIPMIVILFYQNVKKQKDFNLVIRVIARKIKVILYIVKIICLATESKIHSHA